MNDETYYRDHWVDIEPERMESYEQILQWRPEMEVPLAPAEIAEGPVVAEAGAYLAMLPQFVVTATA